MDLSEKLEDNVQGIQNQFHPNMDLICYEFIINQDKQAALFYFESLSDANMIDRLILGSLLNNSAPSTNDIEWISNQIQVSNQRRVRTVEEVIDEVNEGNPVLLIDNSPAGIAFGLTKKEGRSVEEPLAEPVIRGPREGFTETLSVNASLLRRRIKSASFKMVSFKIGRQSKTKVTLYYIEGIASQALVEEATKRLSDISLSGVMDSGYIEEALADNSYSPFPQFLSTERPDVVAASLIEGRIAILVDGSPIALIAPITFFSLLQTPEDYYQMFFFSTFIRCLRYVFVCIALLAPSAYIAVLSFHQEMIPTTLMLSISKSREEIPFPALIEALLMEITFEALREAGTRLPKQVGAAVSIVGALVIGEAATSAGLVSSPMVMIVAITGIASFLIPRFTLGLSIRLLRFPIMLLSGNLGFLGLILGVIAIVIHLSKLHSMGHPYLAPVAPMNRSIFKDFLLRDKWSKLDENLLRKERTNR
ncbi:spore germination protein [Paenibacillus polysaccharolyticus]|uniref:spore germination protein n=1 Tax=Paenibacillus polysaccharolyticus TaxID=582692 RepID=UPI00209F73AD|nr:spore germination protein [Paenibacillus polysaccharolyticus]MCP1136244.1 spore germination protein [Paenibacillus polysaccharolyticus]